MDSKKAISKLEFIDDVNLFKAVTMALWLYLDKESTLTYSVKTAARKCGVTQISVMTLVKSVVPASYIKQNKNKAMPQDAKDNARARAIISSGLKSNF